MQQYAVWTVRQMYEAHLAGSTADISLIRLAFSGSPDVDCIDILEAPSETAAIKIAKETVQ